MLGGIVIARDISLYANAFNLEESTSKIVNKTANLENR